LRQDAIRIAAVTPPSSIAGFDLDQIRQILPTLIDSLSDAVVVVDADLRVIAANRRYLDAFGTHHHYKRGSRCESCLSCPVGDDGVAPCVAAESIDAREPRQVVRSLARPDGRVRRWEATFNPVVHDGRVTHVVEVWRDISERAQLESQLAHSERLAAIGTLAAGVGHEINNPLAAVLAGVESLQRSLDRNEFDPAEAAGVLGVLERETRRCREITDKLMLLAQPYQVAPGWLDLNRTVRDTASLLRHEARRKNVEIVERLDETLPEIWGKESGMRGVCMNLMMNAVQAMAESGGTLTVTTRGAADHAVLEVADTGPGVPPAIQDRIWDPFFTTKPVGHGTGLGLSVTQRVVWRHGGTIRVESEPGRGARFVVTLPVNGPGGDRV
jgi:PAS domain S-box-containing protein